jgi:hypothetical protein
MKFFALCQLLATTASAKARREDENALAHRACEIAFKCDPAREEPMSLNRVDMPFDQVA